MVIQSHYLIISLYVYSNALYLPRQHEGELEHAYCNLSELTL